MKNKLFLALLCVFMFTSTSCTKNLYELKKYKNEVTYNEYTDSLYEITEDYQYEYGKDYKIVEVTYYERIKTKIIDSKEEVESSYTRDSEYIASCDFKSGILYKKRFEKSTTDGKEEVNDEELFLYNVGKVILEVDVLNKSYSEYGNKKQDFEIVSKMTYGVISSSIGGEDTKYYVDKKVFTSVNEFKGEIKSTNPMNDEEYESEHLYIYQNSFSSIIELIICEDNTAIYDYGSYKIKYKSSRRTSRIISYPNVKHKKLDLSDFEYIKN